MVEGFITHVMKMSDPHLMIGRSIPNAKITLFLTNCIPSFLLLDPLERMC